MKSVFLVGFLAVACGASSDPGAGAEPDPSAVTGGATYEQAASTVAETGGSSVASTGGTVAIRASSVVSSTGGRVATGGASTLATGGSRATGGATHAATGGALATGGSAVTGGSSAAATGGQSVGVLGSPCRDSAQYCDSPAIDHDTGLSAPVECIVYQDQGSKTLCVFVSSVGKDCRPKRVLNSASYTGANPPYVLCEQ